LGGLVLDVLEAAKRARYAARNMIVVNGDTRNKVLRAIADEIQKQKERIKEVNAEDIAQAAKANLALPLMKRLRLDDSKIDDLTKGLGNLAELEDPIGKTLFSKQLDEGLELYKVTCPIGVIGVVFESRPDALVQIATLCLKSGNAVILKGGSEAARTNEFLAGLIRTSIRNFDKIPDDMVQLLGTREDLARLLKLDEYVDLLIPRGSSELVRYIKKNTAIPVLGHTEGICHEYVDADAALEKAVEICFDAKVQYPAVCNALNTLLVHQNIANSFLPRMGKRYQDARVELRGDERTREILPHAREAVEEDWSTEHLDLILNVKVVDSLRQAIDHINRYSSHHTDAIVTENNETGKKFLREVDSAVVLQNASTRFSDGYRFGFGAEVGISTNKIHARGPVGLDGLVTYKYIVVGAGHTVSSYVGKSAKPFNHRTLEKNWKY
jgi:glutamate-5-semialdehyde dehydrogenase